MIGPGATALGPHLKPSSVNVVAGTIIGGGTVADVQEWQDGNILQIQEAAATPGQDIQFTVSDVISFRWIGISMYYSGSATHWVEVQIWDNNASAWKTIHTVQTGLGFNYRLTDIPPDSHDFVDENRDVLIRLYHPQGGNASHNTYIDYVAVIV